jgi:tetratricopeptide (TPR) repeat protein
VSGTTYAETDYPHRAFGWSALRALRTGKYLFIQAPERELYNQAIDPGEVHNLAGSSKAVTDTLASQLAGFRGKTSQTLVDLGKPDPEKLQKLQALGYVGSDTAPVQDEKKLTGADPKMRIELSNLLHDAMFDVEDARYEQAIPLLQRALAVQPEMPVANLQYGIAQARLKHFDLAIAPLRKAVTAQPDNGMAPIPDSDWDGLNNVEDRCPAVPGLRAEAGCVPTNLAVIALGTLGVVVVSANWGWPWVKVRTVGVPPDGFLVVRREGQPAQEPLSLYRLGMKRLASRVVIGGYKRKANLYVPGLRPMEFIVERKTSVSWIREPGSTEPFAYIDDQVKIIHTSDPRVTLLISLDRDKLIQS